MRPRPAALAAILLAAAAVPAQTIDLTKWTAEHVNTVTNGTWTTNAARFNTTFNGGTTVNDCSIFYSDFGVVNLEFRIMVGATAGDDDLIGFVLGFNPGDTTNAASDYLLIDWKKVTQSYSNWGTANIGLALSRVKGVPTAGSAGGPIDFWSHSGVCTELARGTLSGQSPWVHGTKYFFRVLYTPSSVDIWLNGQLEFHQTGLFKAGRFGCYDFSQNQTEFQFPVAGSFTAFGAACQGSVGKPSLVAPGTPWMGENLQMVLTNLPPSFPASLAIGVSNTLLQGIPLPFDLAAINAPGCTLYTSSDVLLPVVNSGGTAFINVAIPANLPLSTVPFYVQGMAIDPTANGLGAIFSNAAAGTIGIH